MEQKERWTVCKYITESGDIIEFPNYMVSDQGRVKSLDYNHTGKEQILKQHNAGSHRKKDKSMWYKVFLNKEGKQYDLATHRLVLSSFSWSEYFPNAICDHIDERTENSCDNSLCNLRWVTQKTNTSTDHARTLKSEKQLNDPKKSKRVRVKDLSTGKVTEYPSSYEVERVLELPRNTVSLHINRHEGRYKKRQLHFAYI